jgi:hypothetical protein
MNDDNCNFGFYVFNRPEDDHVMVETCSHIYIEYSKIIKVFSPTDVQVNCLKYNQTIRCMRISSDTTIY